MEDFLIVLVIFASLFGIVFVVAAARNRERMAMIEKGVNPKDLMVDKKPNSYGILKWALLLAGLGFGLFIGSLLEAYTSIDEEPAYFAAIPRDVNTVPGYLQNAHPAKLPKGYAARICQLNPILKHSFIFIHPT